MYEKNFSPNELKLLLAAMARTDDYFFIYHKSLKKKGHDPEELKRSWKRLSSQKSTTESYFHESYDNTTPYDNPEDEAKAFFPDHRMESFLYGNTLTIFGLDPEGKVDRVYAQIEDVAWAGNTNMPPVWEFGEVKKDIDLFTLAQEDFYIFSKLAEEYGHDTLLKNMVNKEK